MTAEHVKGLRDSEDDSSLFGVRHRACIACGTHHRIAETRQRGAGHCRLVARILAKQFSEHQT